MILNEIKKTIEAHSLIKKDDKILVALSGGPDSVALLHLLSALKKKLKFSIAAVYINHQLRPRSAKKETEFCRGLAESLRIKFYTEKIDITRLSKSDKTGIEETARKYRYQILQRICKDEGFDKIAVGHHRDDRVETILFNMFRGTGRRGIVGFKPQRENIIRPLYDLKRTELIEFLVSNKISYMVDSSNTNPKYTRNRIRHRLVRQIKNEVSNSAPDNILRFSQILSDEERFLALYTGRIYQKLHTITPGGKNRLDLSHQLEYDKWLKRRLLWRILKEAGQDEIEFALIERLMETVAKGKRGKIQIGSNQYAEYASGSLFVYHTGPKIVPLIVDSPGVSDLNYPCVRISFEYIKSRRDIEKCKSNPRVACVDDARLEKPITIAGLIPGARMRPYGRPGSKKVGDFLTDIKYPRPLRDELPVVYDNKGIIWLAGVEISHRVAIGQKTRKILKIEIKEC